MATPTKTKPTRRKDDGRVILHVFVRPEVRSGVHMLADFNGVYADDVIGDLVRREMERLAIPVPRSPRVQTN